MKKKQARLAAAPKSAGPRNLKEVRAALSNSYAALCADPRSIDAVRAASQVLGRMISTAASEIAYCRVSKRPPSKALAKFIQG